MDNENLTYQVYRQGTADPIFTTTVKSNFYTRPTITFKDTDVTGGETYNYLVKATDPFGNSVVGDWTPVTVVDHRNDHEVRQRASSMTAAVAVLAPW
ncbi:MAG: hypothetical protein V9E85_05540 [Candidatus Nanopelagicales bacterium]